MPSKPKKQKITNKKDLFKPILEHKLITDHRPSSRKQEAS